MGAMPPAPARFVLLTRSPSIVRVQLDVPAGVVVRDVFVGFILPGVNIGAAGMDPGRVVDATPDGVGEGQHTYALEAVTGELPVESLPLYAGYTIAAAPGHWVGALCATPFWPVVASA